MSGCLMYYLEPLVLEHPLDSRIFSIGSKLRLEDHTKRSVSHNLALSILHLSCVSSQAILYLFTNHFWVLLASDRNSQMLHVFTSHT